MIDRFFAFLDNLGNEDEQRPPSQRLYLDVDVDGYVPFNTAKVKIKAYLDRTKNEKVETPAFKWYRQYENRNYLLENAEDSYSFSSEDLGSKIIAIVSDSERESVYSTIEFGPIILDPQCRSELECSFKNGFT